MKWRYTTCMMPLDSTLNDRGWSGSAFTHWEYCRRMSASSLPLFHVCRVHTAMNESTLLGLWTIRRRMLRRVFVIFLLFRPTNLADATMRFLFNDSLYCGVVFGMQDGLCLTWCVIMRTSLRVPLSSVSRHLRTHFLTHIIVYIFIQQFQRQQFAWSANIYLVPVLGGAPAPRHRVSFCVVVISVGSELKVVVGCLFILARFAEKALNMKSHDASRRRGAVAPVASGTELLPQLPVIISDHLGNECEN